MRAGVLFLTLIILAGCPKDQAPTKPPKKKSVPAKPAPKPAEPVKQTEAEPEAPVTVYKPLDHQPSHKMQKLEFLGWTKSGDRFVLRTEHEVHYENSPEDSYFFQWIHLHQVHDALTGKMVDAYRVKRTRPEPEHKLEKGEEDDRPWIPDKLWDQAKPKKAWAAFLAKNPLEKVKAGNKSPDGAWSLSGERVGGLLASTKFEVKPSRGGLRYEWYNFKNESEPRTEGRAPQVRVWTGAKQGRFQILTFRMAHDGTGLCGVEEPKKGQRASFVGDVSSHWSPQGDRTVLTLFSEPRSICLWPFTGGSHGPDIWRFYLRTPGPQLQLMAPPDAEVHARRLARKLAAGGFPVTQLKLEGWPRKKTLIYHRGDDGEALAKKLAKLFPGESEIKPLKKPGWLRLIVVLGKQ